MTVKFHDELCLTDSLKKIKVLIGKTFFPLFKRSRYTKDYIKTVSCKLCIFNPYSFWVIQPWNLANLLETFFFSKPFISFNDNTENLQTIYSINKWITSMKLRNFIFDKGLFQVSGEKTFFSKSFLRLLVFLKTRIILLFGHWRSSVFHHNLKAFR